MVIYTFGHGTAGTVEIAALLRGAGVRAVVDVRSVPKSRAHPHVWGEAMAQWVPDLAGASYQWCKGLGGFRRSRPDSPNAGLRHPSFRGYADYMQTPPFGLALDTLLKEGAQQPTAIMCSETLWWRCHRRLIADALVLLHDVDVRHLMHAGPPQAHRLTPGVRVLDSGILQYDDEKTEGAVNL
ncbi:MAG: DUF488 domain-containing protein [Candidatus Cybelea sp.]